jgi:hypothetical protein
VAASEQLKVDLAGLEDFTAALKTIRSEMASAHGWMNSYAGELGGPDVDRALERFESHWSDGRSRVDKNCERLIKIAEQAVETIRKADDDLAAELRKQGGNQ